MQEGRLCFRLTLRLSHDMRVHIAPQLNLVVTSEQALWKPEAVILVHRHNHENDRQYRQGCTIVLEAHEKYTYHENLRSECKSRNEAALYENYINQEQ